jgi:transposase
MTKLAAAIDGVIGVDTHRDTLAAASTDMVGGLLAQTSVSADAAGYRRLFDFAREQVPGRRCWAVEGAGSYGAGLAAFLQARGERVMEVARPKRRRGAPAPRATHWTPSARRGRHSPMTIRLRRVVAGTGKPCGCCWPPDTAPAPPRSAPPTS